MRVIESSDPQVIPQAVKTLKDGGIIIYPTETCYGIGTDAANQNSVDKLLEYKSRREGKPISVAVADKTMASQYVETNEIAENLYDNHLPGPITVVSRYKGKLAEGIASEYNTLGIRIPDYPMVLKIIRRFGRPITATSANQSYKPKPYSITSFLNNLPKKYNSLIDLIIDAGTLPKRKVSTVVDTTLNTMNILRHGGHKFDTDGDTVLKATTKTPQETSDFGSTIMLKYIDQVKKSPLIIALGGELGTGKTQLTKGIARQLGIKNTIKSPTFTLINEYRYNLTGTNGLLVHIDTWRLGEVNEFSSLKIDDYLKRSNIIVIEWADKYYDKIKEIAHKAGARLINTKLEYQSIYSRAIFVQEI